MPLGASVFPNCLFYKLWHVTLFPILKYLYTSFPSFRGEGMVLSQLPSFGQDIIALLEGPPSW